MIIPKIKQNVCKLNQIIDKNNTNNYNKHYNKLKKITCSHKLLNKVLNNHLQI